MGQDHETDDRGLIAVSEALEAKRHASKFDCGMWCLRNLSRGPERSCTRHLPMSMATMGCLLPMKAPPSLPHLHLAMAHMGKDQPQALGDGVTSGCCSKLEHLVLWL